MLTVTEINKIGELVDEIAETANYFQLSYIDEIKRILERALNNEKNRES